MFVGLLAAALLAMPGAVQAAGGGKPVRVLFICEHGVAKSLVAARFFERMAGERGVRASVVSRGVVPERSVPATLVANVARDGFAVSGFQPQKLSAADLRSADRVIAFNLDVAAPKGVTVERWDVPALSDDYPVARDAIVARLSALLDRLSAAAAAK